MSSLYEAINPDLLWMDQEERLAAIHATYARREQLAIAGYVPAAARARALAARWLLRLAVRLDERVAARIAPPAGLGIRPA